ncbi:uncharacterized protein BDV14DRAFT_199107 [Aspergillus stella-maris]|uniref:uncharacterized protein n=1 Tax=Aspergillus stella-maris TaxID=1810926 RepID=UPI003CCDC132
MARTVYTLSLSPAPGSRPADLFDKFGNSEQETLMPGVSPKLRVLASGEVLDPDSDPPPPLLKDYTDEDHISYGDAGIVEDRVWKTTRVYEIIGNHPRLVQFRGRDPWTALPMLEKPAATLTGFLEENLASMHAPRDNGDDRLCLKPAYRPLIFQWALQLLSGLSFIHSKGKM